jgi:hypothetical protein
MKRISTSTKAVDLFGAGKHGWRDGDLSIGVQPTDAEAIWFNQMQEEIANVIEAKGITLDEGDRTQLYQAIQLMISEGTNNAIKIPVRFTTTANIVLSGLGTQAGGDWGGALTAGDRILPKDQTTGADRGIYIAAAGAWTRATDADGAGELIPGALVVVSEGVTLADTEWMLTTDAPITIGTTALTFTKQGSSTEKQLQSITATVAGNALTLGSAATTLDFRNPTITNGAPIPAVAVGALSLVVPSGASLGTVNAQSARLILLVAYNAGSPVLCVANLAGGVNLDESTVISPTTISAGATLASLIYSASAVAAGSPFKILGYVDITEAAAGTWATAPTKVQGDGGKVLTSLGSLGYGQTWQNVVGSRAAGTTYYNTTGRPISVTVNSTNGSYTYTQATVNGVALPLQGSGASGFSQWSAVSFIVPPGQSYSVAITNGTLNAWAELR